MAKSKDKKKPGAKKRTRQERRFLPTTSMNPVLVYVVGALGALGLGAGIWGYWFSQMPQPEGQTVTPIFVLSTAGALFTVIAIWLGTSGDAALRVGDAGLAREKGELKRMPWYNINSITWESGSSTLVVSGKDEHDKALSFKVPSRSHAAAVSWIIQEANERSPKALDLPNDVSERFGTADPHAGQLITLGPPQVVGKRCAKSGRMIGYEPDARVCPRCERVYHRETVPSKCKCGESLVHLQKKREPGDLPDMEDEETEAPHEAGSSESASSETKSNDTEKTA